MRETPLGAVLGFLKAEVGYAAGANVVSDITLAQLLDQQQKWLATEHDWPFLKERWDVQVAPNIRYPALPTVDDLGTVSVPIDFERPVQVSRFYNNYWDDVDYGITDQDYNYVNSDQNVVLDPIQKWEMSDEGNFEVWPIPATQQTVRFNGQRLPGSLVSYAGQVPTMGALSTLLDLDDMMVVYFTAVEVLTDLGNPKAQLKLAKAMQRFSQCRGNNPKLDKIRTLGGSPGIRGSVRKRLVPMKVIAVHG